MYQIQVHIAQSETFETEVKIFFDLSVKSTP